MFALLSKGIIKESSENEITVEVKASSSFENKRIENKKYELETMCKKFLGKYLTIKIISQKNKLAQSNSKERKNRKAALNHPMVVEAKQMFNGEIINC